MLIKWADLEVGDKLKPTPEYKLYGGSVLPDLVTIGRIYIDDNYIRIYFEELPTYYWTILHDGTHEQNGPILFEVVSLRE